MNFQTDDDLIKASRNGDMKAFRILVERNESKVAGVIKAMLGDTTEAVDVGQEVFIRFYESLDKFKGESLLSTYLTRIAINLSLNELKKRKRHHSLFDSDEPGLTTSVVNSDLDLKEAVNYEVGRLEPEFKSVVTLRMIEGYSTEETATILNIPIGTVLSRLSRAQKKLRSSLANHFDL